MFVIQETMKSAKLKPKQPKAVRWLSHDSACDTIRKILPSVILHLHQEAAQKNDPQAHGLLKMAENWQFLAVLSLMCDTLPHLSSLSRYFQVTFSLRVNMWIRMLVK